MYRTVSLVAIVGLSTLADVPRAFAQGTTMRQPTTQLAELSKPAAPKPPVGCPEGYKPRPPELNPALGPCIPGSYSSQPSGELQAGASATGGAHVRVFNGASGAERDASRPKPPLIGDTPSQQGGRPETDPIQRAHIPPQESGRPETDPIQKIHASAHLLKPDLALIGGFQLGNMAIPWGNSANLADSAASTQASGTCRFRYKYATRNQGNGGAMATSNQITRDLQVGPLLASNPLPALGPVAAASSSGHLSLTPGTWMIYVFADQPLLVAENNETNNLRRVRVTVTGDCKP